MVSPLCLQQAQRRLNPTHNGTTSRIPPPTAEGPSIYEEWLAECGPEHASESDDDYLYEETDADDDDDTTDHEEDDGEQVVPQRTRTNESDKSQAQKRAREPHEPPTNKEVQPPRQRAKTESRHEKNARKNDFTGNEGQREKVRKRNKDNDNDFCFPDHNQPRPRTSRVSLLDRRNPIPSKPTEAQMTTSLLTCGSCEAQ